jgi:hypothetical protein
MSLRKFFLGLHGPMPDPPGAKIRQIFVKYFCKWDLAHNLYLMLTVHQNTIDKDDAKQCKFVRNGRAQGKGRSWNVHVSAEPFWERTF